MVLDIYFVKFLDCNYVNVFWGRGDLFRELDDLGYSASVVNDVRAWTDSIENRDTYFSDGFSILAYVSP